MYAFLDKPEVDQKLLKSKLVHVGYLKSNIKGQVQSPVKVCEVSEVATNINCMK